MSVVHELLLRRLPRGTYGACAVRRLHTWVINPSFCCLLYWLSSLLPALSQFLLSSLQLSFLLLYQLPSLLLVLLQLLLLLLVLCPLSFNLLHLLWLLSSPPL